MAAVALLRAFLSSRRLIEAALRVDSRSSFGIAMLARLAAAAPSLRAALRVSCACHACDFQGIEVRAVTPRARRAGAAWQP